MIILKSFNSVLQVLLLYKLVLIISIMNYVRGLLPVYRYSSEIFSLFLPGGGDNCRVYFAWQRPFKIGGHSWREITAGSSNFFSPRIDPTEQGGKNENELLPLKIDPFIFK